MMTPEQILAGLKEEVKRLAETVQQLSSEHETLRTQSTAGAVKTVTMANEVVWLNKPTAFSGAEDVLRGNDGRHAAEGPTSSSIGPKGEANPDRRSWERESAHALQYLCTAEDRRTKNDGSRSTRAKRVRSVPKSRVEIREQRRARRNNALDQGDEFQFRRRRRHGVEVRRVQPADQRARTTFQEQTTYLTRSSDPFLWQERQNRCGPEQPVVLNFLRDAPGNQSVPESTQGFQTQGEGR